MKILHIKPTQIVNAIMVIAILIMLALALSGCQTDDLAKFGRSTCRLRAIDWAEGRQAEGYDVGIVTCFAPSTEEAHTVCKAKRSTWATWRYIDPTTARTPNWSKWVIVHETTNITSASPIWVKYEKGE